MKTNPKAQPDELKRRYRARRSRIDRARRDLNWIAREFPKSLLGDVAAGLSRELKELTA